jgi:hypothetical protein
LRPRHRFIDARTGPVVRDASHQAMFQQLKEIAKRIHVTANTLEDMTLKVV